MDIEQQQSEVLQQFVKQAGNLEGASLAALLIEATSHPSLFAFSEILSVPNLSTNSSRSDVEGRPKIRNSPASGGASGRGSGDMRDSRLRELAGSGTKACGFGSLRFGLDR
ncbi:COP9 signalosome complex subunit 7 [Dendrobium catenatum]|uniref:COP9 signalosome complex subunit 7 n=1 Tax=Dendrobium catenatum TaxID=906689 RepID=A0A2I0W656_9ASPA|nr:COP9 signalosome complex subunit 7 [Dendrobium catenatum]